MSNPLGVITASGFREFLQTTDWVSAKEEDFHEMLNNKFLVQFAIIQDANQGGTYWRCWWQQKGVWRQYINGNWMFPEWSPTMEKLEDKKTYTVRGNRFMVARLEERGMHIRFDRSFKGTWK